MKPKIGSPVYFFSRNITSAAIVTKINGNGTVNLCVFLGEPAVFRGPSVMNFSNVSMAGPDGKTPSENCWHWPQD